MASDRVLLKGGGKMEEEKKEYIYAQLNEEGICFSVSHLSGPVEREDMILLSQETDCLGKRYGDGVWEDVPKQEETLLESELITAQMLLNQQKIILAQQQQDEVLAVILLGQQKN